MALQSDQLVVFNGKLIIYFFFPPSLGLALLARSDSNLGYVLASALHG